MHELEIRQAVALDRDGASRLWDVLRAWHPATRGMSPRGR
jgi:hypothetical protein